MPPSTSESPHPRPVASGSRTPLPVRLTTRPLRPWERPRVNLQREDASQVPPSASPEHRRRAGLSRQLSLMAPGLIRQLLVVSLREAAPDQRRELLVRQLRETAPNQRRELLALHLRSLGAGLLRMGAIAGDDGPLPTGIFQDGSLEVWLGKLGGVGDDPQVVNGPDVAPLCAGLGEGDSGRAVVALQSHLLALGYLTPPAFAASPGAFDRMTEAALRAFRSDRLLPPTGYYGALTHLTLCAAAHQG